MTTVYAWPATSAFAVANCNIYLEANTRGFSSPYTNGFQAIDLLGERWHMTIHLSAVTAAEGAAREAFLNRLRMTNWISAWHFARKAPLGTMRGTPSLSADVVQGATALPITGAVAGTTLLPGDMLGVGTELFMVADPVTFDGSGHGTVNIANRVRTLAGLASTTAVVWDKPTTNWRLASPVSISQMLGRAADAMDIEMIETWA